MFEKVIWNAVVAYMDGNELFNKSQHGFRAGLSCLIQLFDHICSILENPENGANVDVIYLDFAKAFDKVDIDMALEKLKNNRISSKMLSFFLARTHSQCASSYFWSTYPKTVFSDCLCFLS